MLVKYLSRFLPAFVAAGVVFAQAPVTLTWEQARERLVANNPTLAAARAQVEEARASEVTAYLRPNPDLGLTVDGFQITPGNGVWRPLSGIVEIPSLSYLHERQNKRELRRDTAKQGSAVAESTLKDEERGLTFTLRTAFVQTLQAKSILDNAKENLEYWDREIGLNRTRFEAGDLAKVDLSRLELQRVQFEADYETALVNLRTAKIQLLMLLNDRMPLDKFDVSGPYDFSEQLKPLEDFRAAALEARPDLKAAAQSVELAKIAHNLAIANGSTDPTFGGWYSHNPSFANSFANETIGGSVNIPLKIFDRNQGEKARTQIDIGRNQRLLAASQSLVLSDVESAYYTIVQSSTLLKPYKARYLPLATEVRDTVAFSYQNGAATLLDFLDAQKAYRDTRLAYLNLIGSYLTAAAQLNMAVGREVIQ